MDNFVIDIDAPAPEVPGLQDDGNNAQNDAENGTAALRNQPELQALIAFAEKYVPFVLILLLKLVFDHRIGEYSSFFFMLYSNPRMPYGSVREINLIIIILYSKN